MLVTCDHDVGSGRRGVEKEERDGGDNIDNIELDDLTDSADEWWLICFVLLNDVIYSLSKGQQIGPWYMSCNYYHKSNTF